MMDVLYNIMLQSEQLNSLACVNHHCHQTYHGKQFWKDKLNINDSPINIITNYNKVLKLLQTVKDDEDFEEKSFRFSVDDDVYDGPNLGGYGGAQERYEETYYEKYDSRFDISSFVDLFPSIHEQFKLNITGLMNCYLICHTVTVKLLNHCIIEYKIIRDRYIF